MEAGILEGLIEDGVHRSPVLQQGNGLLVIASPAIAFPALQHLRLSIFHVS
jgi:hypothetical protein